MVDVDVGMAWLASRLIFWLAAPMRNLGYNSARGGGFSMTHALQPTLQEVLRGYQYFNQWQEEEELQTLPRVTIEESLDQFFELCDWVRPWRPEPKLDLPWLEEERAMWIELVNRHRQQRKG
ncbi:MAG: hypothetical protein ACREEM_00630 [Blastocatellia bacterium]